MRLLPSYFLSTEVILENETSFNKSRYKAYIMVICVGAKVRIIVVERMNPSSFSVKPLEK
jgi:hypothetical protein